MAKKAVYPIREELIGAQKIYTFQCERCGDLIGGYLKAPVYGNVVCPKCRGENKRTYTLQILRNRVVDEMVKELSKAFVDEAEIAVIQNAALIVKARKD